MGKWIAAIAAGLLAGAAFAGPAAARTQVESSLLVKGTIDIGADGRVLAHTLERPDGLAAGIVAMIGRAVTGWRFEPVELQPGTSRARAAMSLRLVATTLDDGHYQVQLRAAQFGSHAPEEAVSSRQLAPPRYPASAAVNRVGGTVYVVVRIGRDGRVEDAIAEQVNLRAIVSETSMAKWRDVLAQAAVAGARKWTFNPPLRGEAVNDPYWSARVPVDFIAPGSTPRKDQEWQTYLPGPRTAVPWEPELSASGADALAADGIHPIGHGPRLLTPLGGS